MAFYGYKGDVEDCYWTPYSSYSYDVSSASVQLSEYDSSPLYYHEYDSSPELNYCSDPFTKHYYEQIQYHSSCNYSDDSSDINYYSFYNYNEPKLLRYEPPPPHHYTHYFPSETKFTISYSKVEHDDTDFDEYDPTPYSGGYDPVSTYGKPLPPSDQTCYPRSTQKPHNTSSDNFRYGSIPSPYGKDDDDDTPEKIPPTETKPADTKPNLEDSVGNEDHKIDDGGTDVDERSSDSESSEDEGDEYENGIDGDYDYQIGERKVSDGQIPYYGSGLEAVDICESIFGYWPCLDKIERQKKEKCRELSELESRYDPFQRSADYLFGLAMMMIIISESISAYDDDDNHQNLYYQPRYEHESSWGLN